MGKRKCILKKIDDLKSASPQKLLQEAKINSQNIIEELKALIC